MAKAKEITGLRADMTYADAAARTVAVRAQEVFGHREGVLDTSDIERVHAMRVATRRLRAVLEFYAPCFEKAELRPALKDVKALADALGARRDPDVELQALEAFAASVGPDERLGVELFIARTRAEQAEGNHLLAAALRRMDEHDLEGRLRALAASAAGHGEAAPAAGGEERAPGEQERDAGEEQRAPEPAPAEAAPAAADAAPAPAGEGAS